MVSCILMGGYKRFGGTYYQAVCILETCICTTQTIVILIFTGVKTTDLMYESKCSYLRNERLCLVLQLGRDFLI